ncbi:thiamine phosphate synthase [Peribacillus frigoritolerans]|uniref:thiamine phosphate synthase n=1 Tax=Peribacillus frigoritolerans TaxID=450367 RepID=UPI0010592813|nr:thiamine phosphate synthase [Peribacillus frigoritolerans]TDL83043.1 thiamine phosphate synthase [Peribacillus frigoritolerans]
MWNEEMRSKLQLYFIMGSTNCKQDPEKVLLDAIDGGITMFQFREKGEGALTGTEKINLAQKLQHLCKEHAIPFIVNDDIELALALNADGVHIGQDDEDASTVRKKLGEGKIVGVSAHALMEVKKAIADGADYIGAGPIYPTRTKADAEPVKGTSLIEEVRKTGIRIPIVGIGGINEGNASAVIDAGADGVSVITAISLAADVFERSSALKKAVAGISE